MTYLASFGASNGEGAVAIMWSSTLPMPPTTSRLPLLLSTAGATTYRERDGKGEAFTHLCGCSATRSDAYSYHSLKKEVILNQGVPAGARREASCSLTRSAYRRVLSVCSQLEMLGAMHAIMTVLAFAPTANRHRDEEDNEYRIPSYD